MSKTIIAGSVIGVFGVIIALILFTNVDELVASKVEFDESTFYEVSNTYPINTVCEIALLSGEVWKTPLADHTEWFDDKFGDIKQKVTDEYYNNMASDGQLTIEEKERLDELTMEYFEELMSRIKPSLLEKYGDYQPGSMIFLLPEHLEEDPECAKILKKNYANLVP